MKRAISRAFLLVLVLSSFALAQVSQQALYETLLKTTPANVPQQFSGAHIIALNVQQQPVHDGMIGAVQIDFASDANAKAAIFLFASNDAASNYNRDALPPFSKDQKLLPYPPMARCMTVPDRGGYCDLWLQGDNAIIRTVDATQTGAEALIGMAFKDFYYVKEHAPSQAPQQQQGACSLLTKSEVEAVLGPIREPEPDRAGGCFYGTNSGDGVTVQSPGTGKSGFDHAKNRAQNSSALQGIGDDAFAFVSLAGFVQIDLIKNNHYVSMIYQNQRDRAPINAARALAAKIASRL